MEKGNNIYIKLVIFSISNNKLKIFLPNGRLPSGRLENNKPLDEIAREIFQKKLNLLIKDSYMEQLYTISRQTGGKSEIAIVYYILLQSRRMPENSKKYWLSGGEISKEFEDYQLIKYAIQRLRWKIEYTNVVYSLLPEEFTFSELQETYEAILGKVLDKRNFRKKILSLGILKETGHIKKLGKARPAEMFVFKKRKLTFVKILQPSD
jgi:8-oxo-dGTP diphosphatase